MANGHIMNSLTAQRLLCRGTRRKDRMDEDQRYQCQKAIYSRGDNGLTMLDHLQPVVTAPTRVLVTFAPTEHVEHIKEALGNGATATGISSRGRVCLIYGKCNRHRRDDDQPTWWGRAALSNNWGILDESKTIFCLSIFTSIVELRAVT